MNFEDIFYISQYCLFRYFMIFGFVVNIIILVVLKVIVINQNFERNTLLSYIINYIIRIFKIDKIASLETTLNSIITILLSNNKKYKQFIKVFVDCLRISRSNIGLFSKKTYFRKVIENDPILANNKNYLECRNITAHWSYWISQYHEGYDYRLRYNPLLKLLMPIQSSISIDYKDTVDTENIEDIGNTKTQKNLKNFSPVSNLRWNSVECRFEKFKPILNLRWIDKTFSCEPCTCKNPNICICEEKDRIPQY